MNTTNTVKQLATLKKIRRLSRLLDTAIGIPGTKFRIGLDPILGLIPGGGDLITAAFSLYIIFLATRFKLPGEKINKMLWNIGLEAVVGMVPLFGDIFDAYYKSNIRNLEILENHLQEVKPELEELADTKSNSAVATSRSGY
ncbi:DUF4112 domain-containing protein [Myxosarcina sp. GI1(2024)]